jgi:hypothetical protein
MKNKKKFLLNILKIAVTSLGLYLAYGKFDWSQLQASYRDIQWVYYLISLMLTAVILILNSWRLQLISPIHIPLRNLLKLNFISRFFNLFLPTSIGGDVFRMVSYKKYAKTSSKSISTIFIDRFIGMTAMITLGTTFYLLPILDKSNLETWIQYVIVGTSLIVSTTWIFIISNRMSSIATKIIELIPFKSIKEKIKKLYSDIRDIRKVARSKIIMALLSSFLSHFISSISVYFISLALTLAISPVHFLVTIPVVNTLLLLPLSINGIGVRDYLFKNLYEAQTTSGNFILLAPLNFLQALLTGMIGGIIYLFRSKED